MIELTGAWQLVAVRRDTGNGKRVEYPFGEHPTGMLLYTSDHRVSVHLSSADREPLSNPDWTQVGEVEASRAFTTYLGYSGRYEIVGDTVVHKVETCSVPNWVGVEQVRHMNIIGDTLVLRAPTIETADGPEKLELHWVRAT